MRSQRRSSRPLPVWASPLAALVILAGCAPGPLESDEPTTVVPATSRSAPSVDTAVFAGRTLSYVYFTDGPDEQATRTAIGEFEAATGARVELQILPFADLEKSLQARLSGGDAPDVARVADWHPYTDRLLRLDPYLGSAYADEFLPGPAAASRAPNGELVAVPSDLTMNGPLVNVDAFEAAGVPLPTAENRWTWDTMIAAAEQVRAANGMESAIAIDKSGHRLSTVLSQFGTRLIGADGQEALDTDRGVRALSTLSGLLESGALQKDFWLESGSRYQGANEMFLAGAVPVYISGNWQVAQFADSAPFRWAAVPNPCAEACGGFPGGKYMVAFQGDEPELSAYFLQFMNSAEQQATIDAVAGWLPTRQDLVSSGVDYQTRPEDMAVFLADVGQTPEENYLTNSSPVFSASATELVQQFSAIAAGQSTPADAVQVLQRDVRALLEGVR